MLPPQLVDYGQHHFPLTADWFIRDAAARHLGQLLVPVSFAEEPLVSSIDAAPPTEPDPLPHLLEELAHQLGLNIDDPNPVIVGRWPLMEQATLDNFRRLRQALGTADGRPETSIASEEPPKAAISPLDSPILTRKALRETPRFGREDFATNLIPRTAGDLLAHFVEVAGPIVPSIEELGDNVSVQDALRLQPVITKAELAQIARLFSSIPQPTAKKGTFNPILEAAKARKELLAHALDPAWAESEKRTRQNEDLEDVASPPIFPRRWDSVYYTSRREVETPTPAMTRLVPNSLAAVGRTIFDFGGEAHGPADDLDSGPAPMDVLDAMQGPFMLPSDITFSLPTSPASDDIFDFWSADGSPSPSRHASTDALDDLDVILPRRARFAPSQTALSALEPSTLLDTLSESLQPVDLAADLSGTPPARSPDPTMAAGRPTSFSPESNDIGGDLIRSLDPSESLLLVRAREILDAPLVRPDDLDFPVPAMPAANDATEVLKTLLPSTLGQLAAGPLADSKASDMLSLGLDLDWRLFSEVPSQEAMLNELVASNLDPAAMTMLTAFERSLKLTSLSELDKDSEATKRDLPLDDEYIRTRRELGLRPRAEGLKRRRLRDLSEDSDEIPSTADGDLLRIFDDDMPTSLASSPVAQPLNAPLLQQPPDDEARLRPLEGTPSLETDVDEEHVLAESENGTDAESPSPNTSDRAGSACLDLLNKETPTLAISDHLIKVNPTSALTAFLRTRGGKQTAHTAGSSNPSDPSDADTQVMRFDKLSVPTAASTAAPPSNLPVLALGGEANAPQDMLDALCGSKLLNNRKAWRSLLDVGFELHDSDSPLLKAEPAFSGLDLITAHVGISLFPLGILPSIVSVLSGFLPDLRGHVSTVVLLGIIPPNRDVWTDATRRSVGVLRRSMVLFNGLDCKLGWCDEAEIGHAVRRLVLHQ